MSHTTHHLQQGSPEWLAHRGGCNNASDLAAALGISSYKTRTELIREIATGITPDIDEATQRRFDDGHRFEALARPLAEKIIGDELYPMTVSVRGDGLQRPLGASLDGATAGDETNFEHKSLNASLAAALDCGDIPAEYHPQMEQGQLINGATRTLFMASKWAKCPGDEIEEGKVYGFAPDETGVMTRYVLVDEKHCWYESNPELRATIIPTWRQAEEDAANYQHVEAAPAVVAAPIQDLPALAIEITGRVVASNLGQWKAIVTERIQAINTDLASDQDFADAAETVKFLENGEKRIALVKSQAQAQATDIDAIFRAMDDIAAEMRAKRLELDKLVERRKTAIREEVVTSGRKQFAEHMATLNTELGKPYMPQIVADFAAAIKGKRTVASLRDAADTLLSQKKLEADMVAAKIAVNLESLRTLAAGHAFLFSDTAQLVLKDGDAVEAIIKSRIAEHQAAEEKRLAAEREKIRAEEEARANAAAAAKLKAEQEEAERLAREQREREHAEFNRQQGVREAEAVREMLAANTAMNTTATASQSTGEDGNTETPALGQRETVPGPTLTQVLHAAAPEEIAQVVAPADTGATMKLGDISSLLGFTVTADFLAVLGFQPARTEKAARLYPQRDFPAICAAIARHVNAVAATAMQKAA